MGNIIKGYKIDIPNVTGNIAITVNASSKSDPTIPGATIPENGNIMNYMTYNKGINQTTAEIKDEAGCWATVNSIEVEQGAKYTLKMDATWGWVYSFDDNGNFVSALVLGNDKNPQELTFTADTTKIKVGCYDPNNKLTYCTITKVAATNPGDNIYSITNNLTNCVNSNTATSAYENSTYIGTITENNECELDNVNVVMGGTDITSTVVSDIPGGDIPGGSAPEVYSISYALSHCASDNTASAVIFGNSYSTTIKPNSGYELMNISITMGGTNVTSNVYTYQNGNAVININKVTGNVIIVAQATEVKQEFTLKTMTATLTLDKNINEETGAVFDDDRGGMYATINAIPVKPNSDYTLNINTSNWLDIYEYDSSGNFIKCTNIAQDSVSNFNSTYTTPSNCNYIRIFNMSPDASPVLTISGQLINGDDIPDPGDESYTSNVTGLIANDTSAAASNKSIIENALNSAGSGGSVKLPVGTYYISVGLNIPANVTLEGKSAKETILQLHSPSDRYYVASNVGGNTTLKNFTYKDDVTNNQQPSTTDTMHKDNNQALLMVTGNNVTFDSCSFHNSSTWLIACDDTSYSTNTTNNFTLKNCYIKWHKRSYYTTPFDISQVYVVSEKMTFINNTFETDAPAFSRSAFDIRGFHITMTGNKIYNFVQPALVGNATINARTSGLTQKHIITDNTFIGCKIGTMIYSYTNGYDSSVVLNHHYSHLEYKRNTVEVNTDVLGIGVDNNQGQSIAGIVCYGGTPNEYSGITIEGNTFNCASPNTVKTHASLITGIGLYNGSALNIHDVSIKGNTIKNFPYTGLIVGHQPDIGGSTRSISITNNIFLNNGRNSREVWPYSSHLTIMDANINGLTITGNNFTSDGTTTVAKYGVKELGYNSNYSNINISNNTGNLGN